MQNLAWGLAGPFAGVLADRWGAFRVLVVGGVLYAARPGRDGAGDTAPGFLGGAGLLIGMAQSGTTYAVIYGVIGRNVAPEKRSWAMGVAAAAGSFGQFLMVPVESGLIGGSAGRTRSSCSACAALPSCRWRSACASRAQPAAGAARSRASARRCARRSATAASSC